MSKKESCLGKVASPPAPICEESQSPRRTLWVSSGPSRLPAVLSGHLQGPDLAALEGAGAKAHHDFPGSGCGHTPRF